MEGNQAGGVGAVVDLRSSPGELDAVKAALDDLALKLTTLWSSALERGEFREIDRLVEASHALHRAAAALSADTLVPMAGPAPAATIDPRLS